MKKTFVLKEKYLTKKTLSTNKSTLSISNHYHTSVKSCSIMEQNRLERINSFKN